jgi:hypothetical protein
MRPSSSHVHSRHSTCSRSPYWCLVSARTRHTSQRVPSTRPSSSRVHSRHSTRSRSPYQCSASPHTRVSQCPPHMQSPHRRSPSRRSTSSSHATRDEPDSYRNKRKAKIVQEDPAKLGFYPPAWQAFLQAAKLEMCLQAVLTHPIPDHREALQLAQEVLDAELWMYHKKKIKLDNGK